MLDLEHSLDNGLTWQPRGHLSVSGGRSTNDQNQLDDGQKQALRVSWIFKLATENHNFKMLNIRSKVK